MPAAACALLLVLAIAGCGSSSSTTGGTTAGGGRQAPPASASAAAAIIQRSASARGREPGGPKGAAGACGKARGEIPTLTIEPDVPSPRCLVVSPRQRLRVLNETGAGGQGAKIAIDFAGFHVVIPPGESAILEDRVGTYLMPGSHYLQVHGGPGPAEIRLAG